MNNQIDSVIQLFNFFQLASPELDKLMNTKLEHFYKEYIGQRRALKPEEFALLVSKSSYKQIACYLDSVFHRCDNPTNNIECTETYLDELTIIYSLHIWFNNFLADDIEMLSVDILPSVNRKGFY